MSELDKYKEIYEGYYGDLEDDDDETYKEGILPWVPRK